MDTDHLQLIIPEWALTPSEELVSEYEEQFRLRLPSDYREFLASYGGAQLDATCQFKEPTPFGSYTHVDEFYGFMPESRPASDVRWATELIDGAPDIVAIASDMMGGMIWLKCTGADMGYVYYNDPNQRWTWPDEWFDRFENLGNWPRRRNSR